MSEHIVLVAKAGKSGELLDVRHHDTAPDERACMLRTRFNGARPLRLEPDETAYIFLRGGTKPVRIGFSPSPTAGGFPRWGGR
jgi:hypothetical protein